jgi:hypothetical protein
MVHSEGHMRTDFVLFCSQNNSYNMGCTNDRKHSKYKTAHDGCSFDYRTNTSHGSVFYSVIAVRLTMDISILIQPREQRAKTITATTGITSPKPKKASCSLRLTNQAFIFSITKPRKIHSYITVILLEQGLLRFGQ